MRMGNIGTMAVLAAAMLLGACGKSEEATQDEAKAAFIAQCTAAGTGEAEVSAEKMNAYCGCMAESTLAMQNHLAEGTVPDDAEIKKMQEESIACMKHLE